MWHHWRKHHDCKRFEVDTYHGLCVFCRVNEELIHKGYEVVPFDMPGAYDLTKGAEPTVILQSLHYEPEKPS